MIIVWGILAVLVLVLIVAAVMKGRILGRLYESEKDDDTAG